MLGATRQNIIYDYIKAQHEVSVSELMDKFNVTDMTIRRDLYKLQDLGLIRRVHGGAVLDDNSFRETAFSSRTTSNHEYKQRIAASAIDLIPNGSSVFIDGSTTCGELAMLFPENNNFTVFTNSLAVVSTLRNSATGESVILIGGELAKDGNTFDGAIAMDIASKISVDFFFFSCAGFNRGGISNMGLIGTQVKSMLLNNSKRRILLADSSKFNKQWLYRICGWDMVDTVITDINVDPNIHSEMQDINVEIIVS